MLNTRNCQRVAKARQEWLRRVLVPGATPVPGNGLLLADLTGRTGSVLVAAPSRWLPFPKCTWISASQAVYLQSQVIEIHFQLRPRGEIVKCKAYLGDIFPGFCLCYATVPAAFGKLLHVGASVSLRTKQGGRIKILGTSSGFRKSRRFYVWETCSPEHTGRPSESELLLLLLLLLEVILCAEGWEARRACESLNKRLEPRQECRQLWDSILSLCPSHGFLCSCLSCHSLSVGSLFWFSLH